MSDSQQLRVAPREEIRAHLEHVLSSVHFRNSRRCSALLRYVVQSALENQGEGIKERIIGQAVFGRSPGYDTNQDAVVRNAAAEVRKRLAQYYQEAGAGANGLRIELPPGTYVPEFRTGILAVVHGERSQPTGTRRLLVLCLACAVGAGVAGWLAGRVSGRAAATELDQFWAPILSAHSPVQVCVGQSRRSFYPNVLQDGQTSVPTASLLPMRDRFLWYGDAIAMAHICAYLSAHDKLYRLRGALVTPYAELQGNPVVLIGAFNNDWTVRLTQDLRFSLINESLTIRGVRDRERGTGLTWRVARSDQGWIADEDYALVTRLADLHTGQTVISAAGITTFGTMAAGEFVTNPEQFRQALKSAPRDWSHKNMQLVLQTKVAEGTPGPPQVLAVHFW